MTNLDLAVSHLLEVYRSQGRDAAAREFSLYKGRVKAWELRAIREAFQKALEVTP